jgi:Uma2 family endonuclease
MQTLTLVPDENGLCQLPEGMEFTPGQPITLYTRQNEEESYFPLYLETNENCHLTDDQFMEFSACNDFYQISRTNTHKIVIEMATHGPTSKRNAKLNGELYIWNKMHKLGELFESNGGFILPDGAMYAPDAAFVAFVRWNKLTEAQQVKFPEIVPCFIAELMSASDSLSAAQRKVQEVWMDNGVETGLLIDPERKMYYVYTQGEEEPQAYSFDVLFSCKTLPHFKLNLHDIL